MSNKKSAAGGGWAMAVVAAYREIFLSLAAAIMAAIVVIMSVQIFYRYVLNDSLIWAEEMCRYGLIAMTFLLIGVAYQRGEMVSVQFFIDRLPKRAGWIVLVPVYLLTIGFLLLTSYYGYRYATFNSNFAMPAMDFVFSALLGRTISGSVSMYWVYLLIPLGCLLLAAHVAARLVKTVLAILGVRESA